MPPKTHAQPSATHRGAVAYARVSSKDQEREGFSIPAQLQLLRGHAANRSFDVLQEFIDVETAKQAGRTGFGEMLAFLRNPNSRALSALRSPSVPHYFCAACTFATIA